MFFWKGRQAISHLVRVMVRQMVTLKQTCLELMWFLPLIFL
ncbi:hypothetical protein SAMN04488142_3582 [Halomonas sp. hl-4]|nr:hypothetical protein SAMN04488142_3582 [Halomonas sp. hl-4]